MTVAVVSFLLSYSAQKQYANQGRYEVRTCMPAFVRSVAFLLHVSRID